MLPYDYPSVEISTLLPLKASLQSIARSPSKATIVGLVTTKTSAPHTLQKSSKMMSNTVRSVAIPHNPVSLLRIHKSTSRPRRASIRTMSFLGKLFGSDKSPESKVPLFFLLNIPCVYIIDYVDRYVGRKR